MQILAVQQKGRPQGALFLLISHYISCILSIWLLLAGTPAWSASCSADRIDEYVVVNHVYDGDTVKLADGRKVRLIGVNTPEIGRRGERSEAFAEEARAALQKIVQGRRLGLRYDQERRDRYGRVLAHLYVNSEENVEVQLLERGYGSVLTVPPNVWNVNCYVAAERRAQDKQHKIWSSPPLNGESLNKLSGNFSGYRVVSGEILHTKREKGAFMLHLSGDITVYISARDLSYFNGSWPKQLQGAAVQVKGWVRYQEGGWRIQARHPTALSFMAK